MRTNEALSVAATTVSTVTHAVTSISFNTAILDYFAHLNHNAVGRDIALFKGLSLDSCAKRCNQDVYCSFFVIESLPVSATGIKAAAGASALPSLSSTLLLNSNNYNNKCWIKSTSTDTNTINPFVSTGSSTYIKKPTSYYMRLNHDAIGSSINMFPKL